MLLTTHPKCRPQWSRSSSPTECLWLTCVIPQESWWWVVSSRPGWAWHVLLKHHLRPASRQRTAVHTVFRRLWLLRIMTMSHITEKPSYWRLLLITGGHLQVSGSPFKQEKVFAFPLSPPKYVSHKIVEESLPHQQIVFWSERVSPLMLSVEKCWVWMQSLPWNHSPLFFPLTYFWGYSQFPSLPAIKATGELPFYF